MAKKEKAKGEKPAKKKGRKDAELCEGQHTHDGVAEISEQLPSIDTLFQLAELFKVFGDSTRIRVMCVLFQKELCVCEIAELLEMGQSAISHQLRLLRGARLVKVRRDGKQSYYSLDDDHVREMFQMGLEHIRERADQI